MRQLIYLAAFLSGLGVYELAKMAVDYRWPIEPTPHVAMMESLAPKVSTSTVIVLSTVPISEVVWSGSCVTWKPGPYRLQRGINQ